MRLSGMERSLKAEWCEYMSKYVDEALPTFTGILEFTFKGKDTLVTVCIDDSNYSLKRFEINDIHVWNYVLNVLYRNFPKFIAFGASDHKGFSRLEFQIDFNKKFSQLYGRHFKELANECFEK